MASYTCRAGAAAAVIVLAALPAACHGGGRPVSQINPLHIAHNYMTDHLLTVNMGAKGGSRQWGTASIGDNNEHGVDVAVDLENAPKKGSERAYIGRGNCTAPPATPWKPLQPVVGGKSKSKIARVTVGDVKKGRYSLVVLGNGSGKPVSCGDFEL